MKLDLNTCSSFEMQHADGQTWRALYNFFLYTSCKEHKTQSVCDVCNEETTGWGNIFSEGNAVENKEELFSFCHRRIQADIAFIDQDIVL